ncbi:MAG TPA: glycosyltransferase [Thermoanaerobaculia bacterium]|nr:glycosyltransferase [Thermoanaerobaculia bacterium]
MRLAVLTPLPPARSGVAHYASLVLPALATRADVRAFATLEGYRAGDYDAVIYQLGNNPHHELMYREAMRTPGVVVLHDLVLHHLIVEMTLARGDAEAYVAAMQANHGEAGAAWARGRAAGLHSEMGNFLLPASVEIAQRSRAVIVHNEYAAARLRSFGVTTPIHVVPHPYVPETRTFDRDAIRAKLGFTNEQCVIGFFGFVTSAKRAELVLAAFRIARERDPRLALLIVGEPAPNIDVASLQGEGIVLTGYVDDDEFPAYYAAADRFVNLRYPSAGETSGTLIRAFDAGRPVAVSEYAQFAELPADCVFKVPLGAHEVETLVEFFTRKLPDPSRAQRAWLEEHARVEKTVAGYLNAIRGTQRTDTRAASATLPLFPQLELVSAMISAEVRIVVRNVGEATILTRTYHQPEYRMIAKLFDGERQVQDRWLALPCDLRPRETVELSFPRIGHATTLRLYHALQDVPMLEPEAFA